MKRKPQRGRKCEVCRSMLNRPRKYNSRAGDGRVTPRPRQGHRLDGKQR